MQHIKYIFIRNPVQNTKNKTKQKRQCCYHFGKFLSDRTVFSVTLQDNLTEQQKGIIVNKREHILSKFKHYIDSNLDPRKKNSEPTDRKF